MGWIEAVRRGEKGYMKGHVRNFVGGVLKKTRCHLNVRVLERTGNDDTIERFFSSVTDTRCIFGNSLNAVLCLILDLGYLGYGVVQANGGIR